MIDVEQDRIEVKKYEMCYIGNNKCKVIYENFDKQIKMMIMIEKEL